MRVDSTLGYQNIVNRYDNYGAAPVQESSKSSALEDKLSVRKAQEAATPATVEAPAAGGTIDASREPEEKSHRGSISIEDVQTSFSGKDAGLFGRLGINSTDMRAAISAMQRDSVMQEYQYFVGDRANDRVLTSDNDGTVLRIS